MNKNKILVFDDEPIMRDLNENIIKEKSYDVICASNGEHGIKLFMKYQNEIILLISNIVMPKLDGVNAYYKMHEKNQS